MVFPEASVTVQITVVIPAGKVAPARVQQLLLKLFVIDVEEQLSLTEEGSNSVPTAV